MVLSPEAFTYPRLSILFKTLGLNWIISSGCDKNALFDTLGFHCCPQCQTQANGFQTEHAYLLQFDKLFPKHPAIPPASVYHICFPLSSPGMLHNAASTISMCCLAAKDQTNIFLSQCKQKRLCCACMLLPKQVVPSKQVSRNFINALI